jgi:hypothetical protein
MRTAEDSDAGPSLLTATKIQAQKEVYTLTKQIIKKTLNVRRSRVTSY